MDDLERCKELLREAYAILSKYDKPNIRPESLISKRAEPGPVVPIITPIAQGIPAVAELDE